MTVPMWASLAPTRSRLPPAAPTPRSATAKPVSTACPKAARVDGKRPMIKSHVNTWLRQHPQVLGFTSCLPRHGGTGALYVMLKRNMLEGRDE